MKDFKDLIESTLSSVEEARKQAASIAEIEQRRLKEDRERKIELMNSIVMPHLEQAKNDIDEVMQKRGRRVEVSVERDPEAAAAGGFSVSFRVADRYFRFDYNGSRLTQAISNPKTFLEVQPTEYSIHKAIGDAIRQFMPILA